MDAQSQTIKKKIIGVISSLEKGGAEKNFAELFNNLSNQGYCCEIVYFAEDKTPQLLLDPRVRLCSLGKFRALQFLKLTSSLRRKILQDKPDCIISFMDQTNILVLLALKIFRPTKDRIIVCERNNPDRNLILSPKFPKVFQIVMKKLRNYLYKKSDAICTQTKGAAQYFTRYSPQCRVHVVPNFVAQASAPINGQRLNKIISVGRLVPEKGHALLIKTFLRLAPNIPGWTLEIYGKGEEYSKLQSLIRDYGVEELIDLKGHSHELEKALQISSIFVLNSEYEGFPNALLEAMAHGCACISTDCSFGPAEIITDGEDGLLFGVRSQSQLEEKLLLLINDATLRARIAQNAIKKAEQFSSEAFVAGFKGIIAKVTR